MQQRNKLAVVTLAALVASCSETTPAPNNHGKLWDYRTQLARDLTFRTGKLDSSIGPWVRPCHKYWATGHMSDADTNPVLCDENARNARRTLETYLGVQLSLSDVKDPELWKYLSAAGAI